MLILMLLHDIEAAEDDQIVVAQVISFPVHGRGPMKVLIRSPLKETVQCFQASLSVALLLGADLLQTENVRVQSDELRPENRNAFIKAGAPIQPIVQAHEVECRYANLDCHLISPCIPLLARRIYHVEERIYPLYL